jgi:hypothetical protein
MDNCSKANELINAERFAEGLNDALEGLDMAINEAAKSRGGKNVYFQMWWHSLRTARGIVVAVIKYHNIMLEAVREKDRNQDEHLHHD